MRIALIYDLVYPYSKGGVEKRISDLARHMSARGHEIHIVGTKYWGGAPDRLEHGIWYHGVCEPADVHTKSGRRSIWQASRFAVAAARAIGRQRFDVVEVQGMTPLTCLAVLVRCRFTASSPLVIWYEVWREYWNDYLGPLGYGGRLIEWLVARLAPSTAAVSNLAMSRLNDLGVRGVSLLPIGIDYQRIQSVPPDDLRSEILYVGRLAHHKNVDLLIDALSILGAEGIQPSVLIVGEGPEREALEQSAAVRGLDNVRFMGSLEADEEVISLMKSTEVFAFPSLREGFGLAPLEAAASGVPVVAVSHPDNATCELIENGVTGIVTGSDVSNYANAIKNLLIQSEARKAMGQKAQEAAEAFDWTHVVGRVEQTYRKAMGNRRAGSTTHPRQEP